MKNKFDILNKISSASFKSMLMLITFISLFLNFVLELLGRHSFINALRFPFEHPVMFLYNSLIILFTLSFCLILKKRLTALFLLIAVWLGLGVTNFILLGYRSSPLSAIDFTIVKSAVGLFTLYLSIWQITLIAAAILLFIVLMVFLVIKCPKSRVIYHRSLTLSAILAFSLFIANIFAIKIDAVDYGNLELADAYGNYGFAYCFTRSLLSQGIKRPDDYSSDALNALKDSLAEEELTEVPETLPEALEDNEETIKPNIIFVQLESFFDLRRVNWIETSDEVTPNFNRLKDGISGYVKMENIGGGTANSEFEILTGMDLDHFGFGEYPYTTILSSHPCESIAYDLKAEGYSTHALHNHTATFYNRHLVYANLGFDSFTPAELMNGLTYNPLGWERDEILTDEIISALDSSNESDFVFAVTVQGHGKYPEELPDAVDNYPDYDLEYDDNDFITVSGCDDEKRLAQFTYYANQLHETDEFIGELIAELEARDEPCVVVFYGDHLPAIALEDNELDGTLFDTDYAVWTNTELFSDITENKDFEAYMLSAYILNICNIDGGDISKLHQSELNSGEDRNDELKILEYSQLYDPDKSPAYETVDMSFGTHELSVTKFTRSENKIYIYGSGFTENCLVEIGGALKNTVFISPESIYVENIYFNDKPVRVVWAAEDKTELAAVAISASDEYFE